MYVHTYKFYRPQFYVLNLYFVFSWTLWLICCYFVHVVTIVHSYVHDLFPSHTVRLSN